MLIQAGGCGGVDSALITVIDYKIFTIEFKEPYAKTSEPDFPKYKENEKLIVTKDFINCIKKTYKNVKYFGEIS